MIGTIIDIETTGFLKFDNMDGVSVLSDKSEILEVGYMNIDLNSLDILKYGTLYFYKPYFAVESDAQKVHCITREFISKYEDKFDENLIALNSLMQCSCIIGKNSKSFDIPFIKAFLTKHAGTRLDIPDLVFKCNMNAYNGGKVIYENNTYSEDVQDSFKKHYHHLFFEKNGYPLQPNKKGTLSDYIEYIPNGQAMVDSVYSSLQKDRTTGAHGALYDVVMTYVTYLYVRAHEEDNI